MPPARPGGTPSAVTVFLPYKSAVTARTLRIRQRVQRAGLDAPARPKTLFIQGLLLSPQWVHLSRGISHIGQGNLARRASGEVAY